MRSLPASSLRGQTFRTVEASYRKAGHVRQWSRDCITVSRCGPLAGRTNFAAGRALSCHPSERETFIKRVSVGVTKAFAVSLRGSRSCSPHVWYQGGDILRCLTATPLSPAGSADPIRIAFPSAADAPRPVCRELVGTVAGSVPPLHLTARRATSPPATGNHRETFSRVRGTPTDDSRSTLRNANFRPENAFYCPANSAPQSLPRRVSEARVRRRPVITAKQFHACGGPPRTIPGRLSNFNFRCEKIFFSQLLKSVNWWVPRGECAITTRVPPIGDTRVVTS